MSPLIVHERNCSLLVVIRKGEEGLGGRGSCVKEGVRRRDSPHLKRGESFIHSSKSTVILAFSRLLQHSVGQCHRPRRGVARSEPCGCSDLCLSDAKQVRRPCADGTVTRNASLVYGGQICTTSLLLLLSTPGGRRCCIAELKGKRTAAPGGDEA